METLEWCPVISPSSPELYRILETLSCCASSWPPPPTTHTQKRSCPSLCEAAWSCIGVMSLPLLSLLGTQAVKQFRRAGSDRAIYPSPYRCFQRMTNPLEEITKVTVDSKQSTFSLSKTGRSIQVKCREKLENWLSTVLSVLWLMAAFSFLVPTT